LNAAGFEAGEIRDALTWLAGLNVATRGTRGTTDAELVTDGTLSRSLRVYSVAEQNHLGAECLGFVSFLESAGALSTQLREIVLDRAMAASGNPNLALDDLKIIILMVYWSMGNEPEALILDELCDDSTGRVAH
jgi:Smg protein